MIKNEDADTFFSRQDETLSLEGGRFAVANGKPRLVGSHLDPYATEQGSPLVTPDPSHGFAPERDRIEPENITPMTYGVDVSGAQPSSVPPAEVDLASPQPPDEGGAASSASPSSSFRRI
jgi:hypothetical protein